MGNELKTLRAQSNTWEWAARDRVKALCWEGDGFVLAYKRLEAGSFKWPRTGEEARALTPQQYRWLMEGLEIE